VRVPDEVRQCVVFVGIPKPSSDGQVSISFVGTAFFVGIPSSKEGVSHVYVVTARHVANKLDNKQFLLRINTKEGSSALIKGDGVRWFTHPTDNSVDVAVIPYAPSLEIYEFKFVHTEMFLSDALIQQNKIGVGDEVFITGLFAHVSGSKKNLPIVRLGNIEAYLIEARSIGGLSGSPAFVRETVPVGLGRFHLLGLMHGHWDIPLDKKNDLLMSEEFFGKVNMGIAIVVPAKKILEVLNHPELIELRRKTDERLS